MEQEKHPVARLRCQGYEYSLFPGQDIHLGRANENEVVINDPKVSRSHAVLEWNGSGFSLRDLGSINGTFLNSERLNSTARLLRDGDQITLSKQEMVFEIIRAEAAEAVSNLPVLASTEPLQLTGPCLSITSGPDQGQIYPLWGETVTIGRGSRDATWEIRLTDRSVSRPHACIERRLTDFILSDLGSANGTLLNGREITAPTLLKNNDTITIGETHMVFNNR